MPVIYTKYINRDSQGITWTDPLVLWRFHHSSWVPNITDGAWEAEIIQELKPQEGDLVLRKTHEVPFLNTGLKQLLALAGQSEDVRGNKPVTTLLIVGTNSGEGLHQSFMTAFGAFRSGVSFYVVKDCTTAEASNFWDERSMYKGYDLSEILEAWKIIKGENGSASMGEG